MSIDAPPEGSPHRIRRLPQRGSYDRAGDRRDLGRRSRLLRRDRDRGISRRDPDGLRAPRRRADLAWRAGQPALARGRGRDADVRDGHAGGRPGAGAFGVSPLAQLPVGGRVRRRARADRRRREGGGAGGRRRAPAARALRGRASAEREGARRHARAGPAHRNGVGQAPHRRSARRRRGRGLALLGGRDPAGADGAASPPDDAGGPGEPPASAGTNARSSGVDQATSNRYSVVRTDARVPYAAEIAAARPPTRSRRVDA